MIYFIRDESTKLIKIGTSIRLGVRLAQLKIKYPGSLRVLAVIPGSYADESALHRRFAHLRIKGEWFKPKVDLLKLIATEGQPWDGSDESAAYVTVKIDSEVATIAKMVAAGRGISLSEYLSEVARSPVMDDLDREYAKRNHIPSPR